MDCPRNLKHAKQFGERLVMNAFAPYFRATEEGAKAAELKDIFDAIRESHPEVVAASSAAAREKALRDFEEAHPELCDLIESSNEFFGFTKGANLLNKHVQWVYIPAVKDASSEQEEGNRTALGQLFQRSIRKRITFKESIAELKRGLEKQYRELIDAEENSLDEFALTMERRLREWTNPDAVLKLAWNYDPNKSVIVQEPTAKATIGEDKFVGDVARLGHGMQRSFLVALLHELAMSSADGDPTLILGFEEPELYQHPSQALHIASVLESLAENSITNSQVILSTHSPHFVSAKGFENVRVIRKHSNDKCSLVASTTFERIEKLIADALGEKPDLPSVTMTSMEQIMQPSQRELYFTKFAILVEGIEDVAFIATHLHVTGRWHEFRRYGCHFIVAMGKTNLSRPIAIARELCIKHFIIFDADTDKKNNAEQERDNNCILRLCGSDLNPMPTEIQWTDQFVVWPRCIFDAVKADIGCENWDYAEKKAREEKGYVNNVKQKNNMLIAAVLEELAGSQKFSNVLNQLCDLIFQRAQESFNGAVAAAAIDAA